MSENYGPEWGSPEYKKQVEQIFSVLTNCEVTEEDLPKFLMMYILDLSYSRAAIAEAHGKYQRSLTKSSVS